MIRECQGEAFSNCSDFAFIVTDVDQDDRGLDDDDYQDHYESGG